MGAEIDRLDIAIEAQAKNANAQIDNLISKLTRMQSALGTINGSGLNQLASGVQRLGTAMQSISSVKSADFSRLTKGIEKIGTVNQGNIGNVANALNLLTQSFSGIGAISSNAMNIGEFAKNVSKLGNKSTTTAITNMPLLASSLKEMMASLSGAPKVSKNLISMTNALANLSAQGSKVGSSARSMNSGFNMFSSGAVKATKNTKSLATSIGMLYGKIYLLIRAFKALGSAVGSSMDFLETSNYFEVAMNQIGEDSADQWKDYGYASAENYADSFSTRMKSLTAKMTGFDVDADGNTTMTGDKNIGLNPEDVMNYQAMYAQMSNSLGLIGETSLNTSKALVMLGADWASLRNISLDTAWEKFASALAGQSRAVRSLGIDITQATLQETAYKYGLDQAVATMNQATKAQLRLLTMLDQSEVAFGDIANTISSPANQLRILQQGFSNLARTIGNLFLPIVSKVLPYINAMVVALQRLFSWIGKLLGIKFTSANSATGGMSDSISDLTDSADDATDALDNANAAAKKLKTTTLGIDELNINDPTDSSSSGSSKTPISGGSGLLDDAIGDALAEYEDEWNKSFDRMDDKISKFADAIEAYFRKMYDAAEPFRNAIKKLWNEGLSKLADFSFTALKDFYENLLVPLGKWAFGTENMGLTRLVNMMNDLLNKVNWSELNRALKEFWIAIEPYAEQFGEGLIDFFEDIGNLAVDVLNKFPGVLDAVTSALNSGDPEKARDWGYAFGQIATAFLAFKGIESIAKTIDKITGTIAKFTAITASIKSSKIATAFSTIIESAKNFAFLSGISGFVTNFANALGQLASINPGAIGELGIKLDYLAQGTWLDMSTWKGIPAIIRDTIYSIIHTVEDGITELAKALKSILSNTFNWDDTFNLLKESAENFSLAFDGKEIGKNIILGIGNGLIGAVGFIIEPIGDFFKYFFDSICSVFGIHSPAETMKPIGQYILLGIVEGFRNTFGEFASAMTEFWANDVAPWFSIDKWSELWTNVSEAFVTKWDEIVSWWSGTAIITWWESYVAPWFSVETWFLLLQGMQDGIVTKWDETVKIWIANITTWWNKNVAPWFSITTWLTLVDGMKQGITTKWNETANLWKTNITLWWNTSVAPWFTLEKWLDVMSQIPNAFKQVFKNAANAAIAIFNQLFDWINEKLDISWDAVEVAGHTVIEAGHFQVFRIEHIPAFQTGGFPEDGLFRANHNELIGQFANGRTAVANNAQIVQGISAGVEVANEGVVSAIYEMAKQIVSAIDDKDTSLNVTTIDQGFKVFT